MKFLIVQPHRDDAIFSIAEHMLTWLEDGHQLTIHTIFGGIPFEGGDDAQIRKHLLLEEEHAAAMRQLGDVMLMSNNYMDHGCGTGRTDTEVIADAIWGTFDVIVRPHGIWHDDHIQVADAVSRAQYRHHRLGGQSLTVWVYDELPYYVQYPEGSLAASADGYHGMEMVGTRDFYEAKLHLTRCYRSQIGRLEARTLMCPERVWKPE